MPKKILTPNALAHAALLLSLALAAVGLCGAAWAAAKKDLNAGSPRTSLSGGAIFSMNSSAQVPRGTLYLSDFLPANVPLSLRARASRVPLGDAPVPGVQRKIERAEIERDLRSFPDVRAALEIPPLIEVRRWSRPLGREELLQAIENTLQQNHFTAALTRRNLNVNFEVDVTEAAPHLKVTQIQPAPDGQGMRVRMAVSSEPRIPPFWVLLDCPIEQVTPVAAKDIPFAAPVADSDVRMELRPVSYALGQPPEALGEVVGRSTRRLIRAGETLRPEMLDPLILVRAGQPVEILLQGRGMRITAEATPLDAGMSGQKIRVRNQVTGKILTATVVGPRLVEIQF